MKSAIESELVYKNSIDSAPKEQIPNDQIIPYYYVSNNRIVIAPRFQGFKKRHKVNDISKLNLKKEKLTGTISSATAKKIENQITTWLSSIVEANKISKNKHRSINYYPVFVTLTLPAVQSHSDNYIKRHLLGEFIKNIKRNYGVKYYFWRAESQKNDNIHFHLLIDKYIDFDSLRFRWNKVLENHGYIDSFEDKHHHRNPNSVDVRSARNIKNFIEYSLKYMIKEEKYRAIEGRLWGMSDELRNLNQFCDVVDNEINTALAEICDNEGCEIFVSQYFTVINFKEGFNRTKLGMIISKRRRKYYLAVFENLYLNDLFVNLPSRFMSNVVQDYFVQSEIYFPRI